MPEETTDPCRLTCTRGLYRWMSREERNQQILLQDLHAEVRDGVLRIDIDIAFSAIPIVSRGPTGRSARLFIGTAGAEIRLDLHDGSVLPEHTQPINIEAQYTGTVRRQRSLAIKMAPELTHEVGGEKLTMALGEAQFSRGTDDSSQFSLQATEHRLNVTYMPPKSIRWELVPVRFEQAMSDFIRGNLSVFTDLAFDDGMVQGDLEVAPDRVEFYGPDRRPVGAFKAALMAVMLIKRGIEVPPGTPTVVQFQGVLHAG